MKVDLQRPSAEAVAWVATKKTDAEVTTVVMAQTWHNARALAAAELGCEPADLLCVLVSKEEEGEAT